MKGNGTPPPPPNLPPHSDEAEAGILGSLMLAAESEGLWEDTIGVALDKLSSATDQSAGYQFYDDRHRRIYQAILSLDAEGIKPDRVMLVQRLRDLGHLEDAGGLQYVAWLPAASPSPAQLEVYANEVVDKYRLRRGIQVAGHHTDRMMNTISADETLEAFVADVLSLADKNDTSGILTMETLVRDVMAAVEQAHEHRNQGLPIGMSWPWSYLNKMTSGIHKRQVFVVGGESSVGKTSWMLNVVVHVAIKLGISIGILSPESGARELTLRMLAIIARANAFQVHSGFSNERDLKAMISATGQLLKAPIWIDDTTGITPRDIRLKCRRMQARYGCQLFILDHLHECSVPEARGDTKLECKLLMEACRWVARRLDVPMIVLSQLNREGQKEMAKNKNRKPMKADLRESGYIEQLADNIGILYRDRKAADQMEADGEDVDEVWPVNMEVCKQRNGPTGRCEFTFRRKMFRYEDRYADTGAVKRAEAQAAAEKEDEAASRELDEEP